MIDDRLGIPRPGIHPLRDIRALRIELLLLARRVEDPEVRRRISAAASRPLPAERVGGKVCIDEGVPEPPRTLQPRHPQILHQKTRHDHAHAVMHPAGRPELPHAGIDDRKTGASLLPRTKPDGVVRPGKPRVVGPQRRVARVGKVVQQMVGKLPPAEFAEIGLRAARRDLRRRLPPNGLADAMPDPSRRDLAKVEMRRQAAGAIPIGPIAASGVAIESLFEESLEPLAGAGLAGRPGLSHRGSPVDRRQKVERLQREALQRALDAPQTPRGGQWRRRFLLGEQRPPEGREHLIRLPLLRGHPHRLEKERTVETLGHETVVAEFLLDRRVTRDHRRLVTAIPDDVGGPALLGQRPQRIERRPCANHEGCAGLRERGVEPLE